MIFIVAIIYIAICTSCRKKHAERLSALGWQASDKGTRDQAAAATPRYFQRFVEHAIVFFFVTLLFLCVSIAFPSYPKCLRSASSRTPGPPMQGRGRSKMTLFVSCFRAAKSDAKTAISAHAVQMQTTPFRQLLTPDARPISSPCWTPGIAQATMYLSNDNTESLSVYNKAMDEIASRWPLNENP